MVKETKTVKGIYVEENIWGYTEAILEVLKENLAGIHVDKLFNLMYDFDLGIADKYILINKLISSMPILYKDNCLSIKKEFLM